MYITDVLSKYQPNRNQEKGHRLQIKMSWWEMPGTPPREHLKQVPGTILRSS